MKAAWYERQGAATDVLVVGEMRDPTPGPGEVRIAVHASGINPGDVKKRSDAFGVGMRFPRVIPHSDGSGTIDATGSGVAEDRVGERVWCYGAQSFRPFGTAAEFVVVPEEQLAQLPPGVGFDQGACLGIPGLTGHRAVHVGGPVEGRTVLVQGGAGAVGLAAVAVAHHSGARVLATVRRSSNEEAVLGAGADVVLRTDGTFADHVVEQVLDASPGGVDHIVEVAFHANIGTDHQVLRQGGSIATYATGAVELPIPFWDLVFKNVRLYFLGSDDFPIAAKRSAATQLTEMLEAGWAGYHVADRLSLEDVALAHELVEKGGGGSRVVLDISAGAF